MASFPGAEEAAFVDFVLGFGEDTNERVAPVGIAAIGVGGYDVFGFGGELVVFIDLDAIDEEVRVEGKNVRRVARIQTAEGGEQEIAKNFIHVGDGVREDGGSETESFRN